MNILKIFSHGVLRVHYLPNQPNINKLVKRFRKPSICDLYFNPHEKTQSLDLKNVSWEIGNQHHSKMIRTFLQNHYWPREPSIIGLWMSLDCPYLQTLTERYSNFGDRYLAFEHIEHTDKKKLVGVLVANKIWPWMIKELQEWARYTYSKPEKQRIYFCAHCLKTPNLFEKYNVPYIYDVEVLGTTLEIKGKGVATQLLSDALDNADELQHPLVQVVALSQDTAKVCEERSMKREWSMDYSEFVDNYGQRVFFPRRPHRTVSIYIKKPSSDDVVQ